MYLIREITTLQLLYYLPDYNSLLQEFVWQTTDIAPKYPRMHKFIEFWKENIEADIHSYTISGVAVTNYRMPVSIINMWNA